MMPATETRLEGILREVLELPPEADVRAVRRDLEPRWDSLAHVSLVLALESEFGVAIDPSDTLDVTSFETMRQLLEARGVG